MPAGAYPWLAAIFAVKDTGLNYMCSASLISDRHVVTGNLYKLFKNQLISVRANLDFVSH